MLIYFYRLSYFIFILFQITNVSAANTENKIAILVNDNVITNYDIEQRVKIFAISNQIQLTAENGGAITNKAVDGLITPFIYNSTACFWRSSFARFKFFCVSNNSSLTSVISFLIFPSFVCSLIMICWTAAKFSSDWS